MVTHCIMLLVYNFSTTMARNKLCFVKYKHKEGEKKITWEKKRSKLHKLQRIWSYVNGCPIQIIHSALKSDKWFVCVFIWFIVVYLKTENQHFFFTLLLKVSSFRAVNLLYFLKKKKKMPSFWVFFKLHFFRNLAEHCVIWNMS